MSSHRGAEYYFLPFLSTHVVSDRNLILAQVSGHLYFHNVRQQYFRKKFNEDFFVR